jgi:hypothetical protein
LAEREAERERKRARTREIKSILDAEEPDDQMELKPRREHVTVEDAAAKRDMLKDDQRWIYNVIMDAIEDQHSRGLPAQNGQAIAEFTTGGGGTGKSDLIRALHASLTCKCESKRSVCVLSAPTGIAAKNIHGFTIHSILSFEVQQGGIGQYLPLVDRKRSTISSNMKDVRLLVLDECSMFSNVMLLKLHRRLCEIGDSNFCMRFTSIHGLWLMRFCFKGLAASTYWLLATCFNFLQLWLFTSSRWRRRACCGASSPVLQEINLWHLFNY